jgi:hypothetical protein
MCRSNRYYLGQAHWEVFRHQWIESMGRDDDQVLYIFTVPTSHRVTENINNPHPSFQITCLCLPVGREVGHLKGVPAEAVRKNIHGYLRQISNLRGFLNDLLDMNCSNEVFLK